MIYYTTIACDEGHANQGIDKAIERGLAQLSMEAGQAVILTDVTTVVVGSAVYVTILARPYNPVKPDSSAFWEELGRAMTINECRVIFKKLGEHLGIDVSEWGEVDDGVKKHYSLDEAKRILEPYKKFEDYLS